MATQTSNTTMVSTGTDNNLHNPARASYGPSTVKRGRRTNSALEIIDSAIVAAVAVEAPVSVRGVYYRAVSAGAVEKNEQGYRLVIRELKKLRESGAVPYSSITDGTRLMRKPASYKDVNHLFRHLADHYRRSIWEDQASEVIILSEKDAISGTVLPVTSAWDVELGITRGYGSITFAHSIAETVTANTARYKTTWIYQLGDHDPSGVDGWRAMQDAVTKFAPEGDVRFERLAVTEEQIVEYDLPTRPTKASDSRSKSFLGESVEVDALPPTVLRGLVEAAIVQHVEDAALQVHDFEERVDRTYLLDLAAGGAA